MLKADEITFAIEKQIERYESSLKMDSVGTVLRVGDNIATIYGLDDAMVGEIVEFPDKTQGLVLNLETDSVGVVIFGSDEGIKEGHLVKRTGKVVQIPVGDALVGRVVNPLGQPLDGKGPIPFKKTRPLEATPPNVVRRQPVDQPLQTGIMAIDAMIPIGRGQRELIIGDRQTGKTAVVVDTILNQKKSGVFCIYVAIGQKMSNVVALVKKLEEYGAMDYTTVVVATSEDPASLQFIAPYAGCAIGEEFMNNGKHAVAFYDDLSKHAQAYRELSLLLNRPPGREAYPGDVFYLHSRLLERAAKLREDLGAGSLTALPIIETQAGDISSYIPTNVISITDGQIYLESELFNAGVRPAINVGLSVSRVGGKAQTKAMKQVAGKLRLALAQYRELAAFAQLSTDLDKATTAQLKRGERMVEILKQDIYQPLDLSRQIVTLYIGNSGFLDDIDLMQIKPVLSQMLKDLEKTHPDILIEIDSKKQLSDTLTKKLDSFIADFKKRNK